MAVLKYRNTETGEWEAIPPIILCAQVVLYWRQ